MQFILTEAGNIQNTWLDGGMDWEETQKKGLLHVSLEFSATNEKMKQAKC